jgi:hypothetical protein
VGDAEPDDADVLERREHAEAAERCLERFDVGGRDGGLESVDDVVDAVLRRIAEELQRHVRLLGVGEIQAGNVGEQLLDGSDLLAESVEVDADEQSFAHADSSDRRRLESTGDVGPAAGSTGR